MVVRACTLKEVIVHMGPNLTEGALQRVARSVSMLETICKHFDTESGVPMGTRAHSTKPDNEDVEKVVKVVLENDLLTVCHGRKHRKFAAMRTHRNPLWKIDWSNMKKWVEKKKKDFSKFNTSAEECQSDSDEVDSEDDE